MKRLLIVFGALAVLSITITSCSASKKDCQGRMHYKLKNGIYL
ncbi:MAG: hypothetical protein ACJ748_13890 [Flavisolibacter sp.]